MTAPGRYHVWERKTKKVHTWHVYTFWQETKPHSYWQILHSTFKLNTLSFYQIYFFYINTNSSKYFTNTHTHTQQLKHHTQRPHQCVCPWYETLPSIVLLSVKPWWRLPTNLNLLVYFNNKPAFFINFHCPRRVAEFPLHFIWHERCHNKWRLVVQFEAERVSAGPALYSTW